MMTLKPTAGADFPLIMVKTIDDRDVPLVDVNADAAAQKEDADSWTLVVIYRGQHCPICTNFLNALDTLYGRFLGIKTKVVAVSADSKAQLLKNMDNDLQVSFPVYYGLQLEDMKRLGVYISEPRDESETDHLFSEPALFVVNHKHQIQLVDIASGPFARPNLDQLLEGLSFARDNRYPIRGTHMS